MVIAQFWAFANDIYTREQGKRLLPVVGMGSSLGAWARVTVRGRHHSGDGALPLMLIAGAVLTSCIGARPWSTGDRTRTRHAAPSQEDSCGRSTRWVASR